MSNLVVLYHKSCPDGLSAAWAIWLVHPEATYIPVKHGETYPEGLEEKDVVIVDFCYPREELIEMHSIANSLQVLDHHISAQEECGDLPFCYFDMKKSGAGIAWEKYHPGEPEPWLTEYIQYRDLGHYWNEPEENHPPHLKEILAALDSYDKSFEFLSRVCNEPKENLILEGKAILRYQTKIVKSLVRNAKEITIGGLEGKVVNSPVLQSEVGNQLALDGGIGVVWHQGEGKAKFSLRSTGELNVQTLATMLGGGGHKNAAGFWLDLAEDNGVDIKSLLL